MLKVGPLALDDTRTFIGRTLPTNLSFTKPFTKKFTPLHLEMQMYFRCVIYNFLYICEKNARTCLKPCFLLEWVFKESSDQRLSAWHLYQKEWKSLNTKPHFKTYIPSSCLCRRAAMRRRQYGHLKFCLSWMSTFWLRFLWTNNVSYLE